MAAEEAVRGISDDDKRDSVSPPPSRAHSLVSAAPHPENISNSNTFPLEETSEVQGGNPLTPEGVNSQNIDFIVEPPSSGNTPISKRTRARTASKDPPVGQGVNNHQQ
jgi:hypothetical protein